MRDKIGAVGHVAVFLLLAATAGHASDTAKGSATVFCHDPARDIVQRVQPGSCDGRRVDPREAERLRERIRKERVRRFRRLPEPDADGRTERAGSGFHVDRHGHILTARHVVDECRGLAVQRRDGATAEATVLAVHPRHDLALVKGPPHLPLALPDRGERPAAIGDPVRLVGYPLWGVPVTQPITIEGHLLRIGGRRDGAGLVVRAPVRPGNSGGPILGPTGRVIGLVTGKLDTVAHFQRTGDLQRHIGIGVHWPEIRAFLQDHGVKPLSAPSETDTSRAVVRIACRS